VRRLPGYRVTAVASLAQARDAARSDLLRLLARESDLISRRVEADLRARWGDPVGGFRVLGAALPSERVQAIAALRGLLDQLRTIRTQAAKQTEGMVLEAIAARSPEVQASRLRLEAAQAYTAAGDRAAAHRMLGGLNDDRPSSRSVASDAATTHVEMLISGGKLEDATTRLAELRANLSADDYDAIRRRIALGWMKQGNLERADSAIARDNSVEGLALSGQIKLYRGDIGGAVEQFMAAGPYAGDRAQATHRTTLLALLQPLERDSMPDLGRAFLQLDQGDTTQAIAGLAGVAPGLPASHGGAALYLLAGRLSAATGKREEAESLFRTAAAKEAPATAPAAELALAELLISDRRGADAIPILEHLILTYPQSAIVPQARRKLDEARGAVPKT
jgi:hypothetical protein